MTVKLPNSAFLRFLVVGSCNTAVGFCVYFLANFIVSYTWAYTWAYAVGIVVSYALNSSWVFNAERHWKNMLAFPLVYVAQYLASIIFLRLCVEWLSLNENISFFLSIVLTIPITFILSRTVFKKVGQPKEPC